MKSLWSQVKRFRGVPSIYLREGWDRDAQRVLPERFLRTDLLVEHPQIRDYVRSFWGLINTAVAELKRARNTETLKDVSYSLPRFLAVGDVDDALKYIEELGKFGDDSRNAVIEHLGVMIREYPKVKESGILIEARLDNPCILVRLLAAGLYSEDRLMLRQVAEVFDVERLQQATSKDDRFKMDKSIHFLYLGLTDKKLSGFQGNKRAAREILNVFEERYGSDEYVMSCVKKLRKYF